VISREEILNAAREQDLTPNVVEKDYVLGWLLAGIAQHTLLSGWVFKGGTCLKKCFFETYRFSEDLDFTVPKGFIYDANAYRGALVECAERISAETGIELLESGIEVRESHDKEGRTTFFGKISYRGPLMPQASTPPRIKIDLTQHEVIVENPEKRPIRHFYSDAPNHSYDLLASVNQLAGNVLVQHALYQGLILQTFPFCLCFDLSQFTWGNPYVHLGFSFNKGLCSLPDVNLFLLSRPLQSPYI